MARYRLIGYYDDNDQVYDGFWDGADHISALRSCLHTLNDHDGMHMMVVAVLDDDGQNLYEPAVAHYLTSFDYGGLPDAIP